MTCRELIQILETFAPQRWAFDFDNVGLLFGRESALVSSVAVSLDLSTGAVEYAIENGCQALITHHPSLFQPTKQVTDRVAIQGNLLTLAEHGIAHIACHTNWDAAPGGINDVLAEILQIQDVRTFGSAATIPFSRIDITVPANSVDALTEALSGAGAGSLGKYEACHFAFDGRGQFMPIEGAHPAVGSVGKRETVLETKIEMIFPSSCTTRIEKAVRDTHPYETPAYQILPVHQLERMPCGRIGKIDPMTFSDFVRNLDRQLQTRSQGFGDPNRTVQNIAVVGGAADGDWKDALHAGADVFVTGEIRHHVSLEIQEAGMCGVAAGHFATENPGMRSFAEVLQNSSSDLKTHFYEPEPGEFGRPIDLIH